MAKSVVEASHKSLIQWMAENGYHVRDTHLTPKDFKKTGRGLMATASLDDNDTIIEVPQSLIITSQVVMRSELRSVLSGQRVTPLQSLCLFLMVHKQRGEASPWHPYISVLPDSYTTPVHWPAATLSHVPLAIHHKVQDQCQSVRLLYDRCAGVIAEMERTWPELRGGLGYDDFTWAWSTVNTRCVYWLQEKNVDLIYDGEDHYALVPYLDLLNHSPSVQVEAAFNMKDKCYRITTRTPVSKGDQVFINYGPHPNEKLLVEYGFIMPDNPNNVVEIFSEEFTQAVVSNLNSDVVKYVDILHQNELHRGHALSLDGLTWSLLTALKILALPETNLNRWAECMEDGFLSSSHESATKVLISELIDAKRKQYICNQQTQGTDDVNEMIEAFCQDQRKILDFCETAIT